MCTILDFKIDLQELSSLCSVWKWHLAEHRFEGQVISVNTYHFIAENAFLFQMTMDLSFEGFSTSKMKLKDVQTLDATTFYRGFMNYMIEINNCFEQVWQSPLKAQQILILTLSQEEIKAWLIEDVTEAYAKLWHRIWTCLCVCLSHLHASKHRVSFTSHGRCCGQNEELEVQMATDWWGGGLAFNIILSVQARFSKMSLGPMDRRYVMWMGLAPHDVRLCFKALS